MSDAPRPIFDRALASRRLERAARQGFEGFLAHRAAEDLADRLATLTRRFPLAVDLGTPTADAVAQLRASGKADRILRLAPVVALAGPGDAVADAEALPLAPECADLVVSLLALQGVNDLPGALIQLRRALRPDGLFIGCLLGGGTLTELRQTLLETEAGLMGGASPRVAPFAEVRDLGGLLQRAGFALPVSDVETVTVRYGNLFALLRDLRAMGLTSALAERSRRPLLRGFWLAAAERYAARFSDSDGRIRARFDLIWLSGWAPHESQQKPLRPGSAQMRLAQALGTAEKSAGEKAGG